MLNVMLALALLSLALLIAGVTTMAGDGVADHRMGGCVLLIIGTVLGMLDFLIFVGVVLVRL